MRNKELVLRRVESLEGKLKRLRNAINERDMDNARQILQETLELRDDLQSMIEREVWLELFEILQGNHFRANLYTDSSLKDKSYEEFMDGKGIVNWWD